MPIFAEGLSNAMDFRFAAVFGRRSWNGLFIFKSIWMAGGAVARTACGEMNQDVGE